MSYIYTVFYLIVSYLKIYNISTIYSMVSNTNIKLRKSLYLFLYIVFSAIYIWIYNNYNYPIIDSLLFCMKNLLLFLCIYKLFGNPIKTIYISILYLSLDSVLISIFQFILSIFYVDYNNLFIKSIYFF